MKRFTLALAVLILVGCGSKAQAPIDQLYALQSENARLNEQVKILEIERDKLTKEARGSLANVGEVKVSLEQALAIAKSNFPYMDAKSWRRVEFTMHNPDRWVSVWVIDVGNEERPYQGTLVLDAITGQVLNSTNAPTGT